MNSAVRELESSAEPELPATTRVLATTRSFEGLYEQYFDFMWRSLRRLGVPPALAEDAAQDAYVVVHRRLADLRPDASPKAWLFGIAMRVASDYRRSLRRKGTVSFEADDTASAESGPFEGTAKAQAGRLLDRFLAELDDDRRAVFVLAELEEMSAPEMAQALSVNVNTVYSRLRVARERFVEFLRSEGGHNG